MDITIVLHRLGYYDGEVQSPSPDKSTYETMFSTWRHTRKVPPFESRMLEDWDIYLAEQASTQYLKDRETAMAELLPETMYMPAMLEQAKVDREEGKTLCVELEEAVNIYTQIMDDNPRPPILVTSLTRSASMVTAECSEPHGFIVGDLIIIAGANELEYNGTFSVIMVTDTEFNYTITETPSSPATGTITVLKAHE